MVTVTMTEKESLLVQIALLEVENSYLEKEHNALIKKDLVEATEHRKFVELYSGLRHKMFPPAK